MSSCTLRLSEMLFELELAICSGFPMQYELISTGFGSSLELDEGDWMEEWDTLGRRNGDKGLVRWRWPGDMAVTCISRRAGVYGDR